MSSSTLSLPQLQRALALAEQIQKLEDELKVVLSGNVATSATPAPTKRRGRSSGSTTSAPAAIGKRKMKRTPEARAKMAAAQKARWARLKDVAMSVISPVDALIGGAKKKRKMSPQGRARIVAALKARHAAAKKQAE